MCIRDRNDLSATDNVLEEVTKNNKTKTIKTEKIDNTEKITTKSDEILNETKFDKAENTEKPTKSIKADKTIDEPKADKALKVNKSVKATEQKSSVVDYSVAKSKMKKGFFSFNSKDAEEDEPVNIVSQILCKNNKESVG